MASFVLRWAYRLLCYALLPLLLLVLAWRVLRRPGYRERWWERFGFVRPLAGEGRERLWIHAVSVGEAQAAVPLVRALGERYPQAMLLITTTTPTGAAHVARLYGESVEHAFVPYDLSFAVSRFLRRVRPSVLLILETELWPELLLSCRDRDIPVVLANARLSARSAAAYRRVRPLFARALAGVTIAAQSESDGERFGDLATSAREVAVCGSLKFDFPVPADTVRAGEHWRERKVGDGRFVIVGGSTHEGEEQTLLDACRALGERVPKALLVLVPRHPERFDHVAEQIAASGLRWRRLTEDSPAQTLDDVQVYLADAMGELLALYAAADVAFVGGSLVPVGGHNPLEPAALGVATLTGPHHHNAPELAERLRAAGALRYVDDLASLVAMLEELAVSPDIATAMGEAGQRTVAANRGAVGAVVDLAAVRLKESRERVRSTPG